ncbi:MAG: DUF2842 domain-containing protein [Pseudomonadota bacterium]
MAPRQKKLLGLFVLVPGVTLYMFLAAAIGEKLPSFWPLQVLYFTIAGLAWALPVKYLITWMNSDPKAE